MRSVVLAALLFQLASTSGHPTVEKLHDGPAHSVASQRGPAGTLARRRRAHVQSLEEETSFPVMFQLGDMTRWCNDSQTGCLLRCPADKAPELAELKDEKQSVVLTEKMNAQKFKCVAERAHRRVCQPECAPRGWDQLQASNGRVCTTSCVKSAPHFVWGTHFVAKCQFWKMAVCSTANNTTCINQKRVWVRHLSMDPMKIEPRYAKKWRRLHFKRTGRRLHFRRNWANKKYWRCAPHRAGRGCRKLLNGSNGRAKFTQSVDGSSSRLQFSRRSLWASTKEQEIHQMNRYLQKRGGPCFDVTIME